MKGKIFTACIITNAPIRKENKSQLHLIWSEDVTRNNSEDKQICIDFGDISSSAISKRMWWLGWLGVFIYNSLPIQLILRKGKDGPKG